MFGLEAMDLYIHREIILKVDGVYVKGSIQNTDVIYIYRGHRSFKVFDMKENV